MLDKCPKCKATIGADAQVGWKCASCKKIFKVSFSRLDGVLSRKQKADSVSLIKCPSCGKDLDDGNEELMWNCLECGNRITGNLEMFKERMSDSGKVEKSGKKWVKTSENENSSKKAKEDVNVRNPVSGTVRVAGEIQIAIGAIVTLFGFADKSWLCIAGGTSLIFMGIVMTGIGEIIQLLADINWKLDRKDE